MPTWAGIVRVSHVGGRSGDSFHADTEQVEQVKRYAAQHGATVVFMEPELSVSGGRAIEDRPSLKAAIEGVEAGRFDGIVVAYLSRLTRSRSGLEIWERVERAGGHVHCAAEQLDTSTPNGRFIRDIHLANAVREREEHADRFELRRKLATEAGIWQRRQVPKGYVRGPGRVLEPGPDADVVRRAFAERAAGRSLTDIADMLGMTLTGARKMLANRLYLGELTVGQHHNPAAHPALVDEDTFRAAQRGGPRPPRTFAEPALLAGLVRCCGCGHAMTRSGGAWPAYDCKRRHGAGECPAPASIGMARLDQHVERLVLAHLQDIAVTRADAPGTAAGLRDALHRAEQELAGYLAAVSVADVGAEAFAQGARIRREAVDAARAALEAAGPRAEAPELREAVAAWERFSSQARNRVLRGVLAAVLVERGGGRGARRPLEDRVRVITHDAGLVLPGRSGDRAHPIAAIRLPDLADPGVLGELGG